MSSLIEGGGGEAGGECGVKSSDSETESRYTTESCVKSRDPMLLLGGDSGSEPVDYNDRECCVNNCSDWRSMIRVTR